MAQLRRRGFTLVELLVVIGIIVVLIAIIVMGVRHTTSLAARHETEAELKVCVDLLREYQSINGMKNIAGPAGSVNRNMPLNLPYPPWLNHSYNLPIYVDEPDGSTVEVTGPTNQPQSVLGFLELAGTPPPPQGGGGLRSMDIGDMSDKTYGSCPRWGCTAVYNTQGIMYLLLKNPKNRAIVEGMPPKRILETWAPFTLGGTAQKPFTIDAAVLLDGWGNPIVFVPRGGIHVWVDPPNTGKVTEYIVRSSGTYPVANGYPPPLSPLDRPFFASAGPDGYFADLNPTQANKKDRSSDNLYSFQAQ